MQEKKFIVFNQYNVYINLSPKGYGYTYFAKRDFKKEQEIIKTWNNKIINHQTVHCSMQIDTNKHFIPKKWLGRYLNHSCDPNIYAKTGPDGFPIFFTLRDIKKGEEISYNYAMTEYRWIRNADENFVRCMCRTKKCKGRILSFSQLTKKEKDYLIKSKICSKYLMNHNINKFFELSFLKLRNYNKNISLNR